MWRDVSGTVGGGRSNGSNGSRTVVSSDNSSLMQDGYSDGPYIKPNLAGGINLPEREEIKADGGLYWQLNTCRGGSAVLALYAKNLGPQT